MANECAADYKLMRMAKGRVVSFMFDGAKLYGHISGFKKSKDGSHMIRIEHDDGFYSIALADVTVGDES